jgi:5-methylcytosine-specific restriction endonuclease McrA
MITAGMCAVPGCPNRIVRYGRCEAHALAERRRRHETTRAWDRLRQQVRDRAGGRCERCGVGPAVDVHHLDAMASGGPRVASTARLMAVCETCHAEEHHGG